LLRGWIHAAAAVAALVYTVAVGWRSWGNLPVFGSLLVFGLGMIELYTVSAIYHLGHWHDRARRVLRAIDHSNIFVLIAATYTPLCFNLLAGWMQWVILGLIWVLAIAGVAISTLALHMPRWVNTVLYIGMGWLALLAFPAFLQVLPLIAVGLLVLGGLLYTVGAVVYALKRPNPFPRVLGFHEIFHLFTIAAGMVIALVIWVWVVPSGSG
jgi:hemolysin III